VATSVVWFRRDLRLHDHPALTQAAEDGDRIAPLFVIDHRLLDGRWRAPNRLWWMRASIAALAADFEARGVTLHVFTGDPREVVPAFATSVGARRVLVTRDLAPYGRTRDAAVSARLASIGVRWEAATGLVIQEPEAVQRAAGRPFVVFGPFHRAWLGLPRRAALPAPDRLIGARAVATGRIEDLLDAVEPTADRALLPAPGEDAARRRLERWATSPALDHYDVGRDRLDLDGTSRLSQDLRWGSLSAVEVAERCDGPGDGRRRFLAELAWRDFYAHRLWHDPRAARLADRPRFETVAWQRDPTVIEAWRRGRTGYPVVDAAMRQLLAMGWMHNRARMIAASFLTKHLGVDWRVGERHFMEHLLDGDPASNNGGWQWAASTGADAQPWFRVFNPAIQGRRHDPDGDYVRRWVPELADRPGASVHDDLPPGAYLPPIVHHREARDQALAMYRAAARSG